MSLAQKNIVITPNIGQVADPKIVFSGADASTVNQDITLRIYPTNSGTLSFEGSSGQLFSIANTLTGTIYSVNDISGIPSIEVLDTGLIKLGQYNGNILIGTGTEVSGFKLQLNGNMLLGNKTATSTTSTTSISLGGSYSSTLLGNTNGTNLKIKTYDDGTYYTGFGNSSGQLDYVISGSGSHVWYSNNQQRMKIDQNGVFSIGSASATLINGACIYLQRNSNVKSGISWYQDTYNAWSTYMSNVGTTNSGPSGLVTAPNGTYVTGWALRNFVESTSGYGWTWEAGGATEVTPWIIAELSSYTGNFKVAGILEGTSLKSIVGTGTAPITVASTTMVTNLNANFLNGVASTGFATSTHTHGLARHNITAPSTIDTLTTSNFRTTLFGTTVGSNLSVARWDNTPTALTGMGLYGTMIAWGAADTHGFLAVDYSTGSRAMIGGGSADSINWAKEVALITATTTTRGSIDVTTTDSAIRLKTTGGTANKNTWEIRSVPNTGIEYLQFRTINDAQSVFTTRMALWNTGGLYIGTTPFDAGIGSIGIDDKIQFTSATDCTLWRSSASNLKTNANFIVGNSNLYVDGSINGTKTLNLSNYTSANANYNKIQSSNGSLDIIAYSGNLRLQTSNGTYTGITIDTNGLTTFDNKITGKHFTFDNGNSSNPSYISVFDATGTNGSYSNWLWNNLSIGNSANGVNSSITVSGGNITLESNDFRCRVGVDSSIKTAVYINPTGNVLIGNGAVSDGVSTLQIKGTITSDTQVYAPKVKLAEGYMTSSLVQYNAFGSTGLSIVLMSLPFNGLCSVKYQIYSTSSGTGLYQASEIHCIKGGLADPQWTEYARLGDDVMNFTIDISGSDLRLIGINKDTSLQQIRVVATVIQITV